jgi:hypothetical protein
MLTRSEIALNRLSHGWLQSDKKSPRWTPPVAQIICCVPGCMGMSFTVQVTETTRDSVCFRHYEEISRVVEAQRHFPLTAKLPLGTHEPTTP